MQSLLLRKRNVFKQVALPSLLINLLSLAVPLTVLQIYDRILPNQSYGTATLLIAGATVAVLIDAFLRFVRSWILAASASNTEKTIFSQLVSALANAKPTQLQHLKTGVIQDGLGSIGKVKELYSGGTISGLIDLPFALLFLALVAYVGGELVFVPIIVWFLTFAVVWISSLKTKALSQNAADKDQQRTTFLSLMTDTVQGIKRQAVESRIYAQFKRLNQARYLTKTNEEQQNTFAQECIQMASLGTSVILVIVGSLWVLDGELTTGGLAACSILSGRAVAPLSAIVGLRVKLAAMHSAQQTINAIQTLEKQASTENTINDIDSISLTDLTCTRFTQQYQLSGEISSGDIVLLSNNEQWVSSHLLSVLAGVDQAKAGTVLINKEQTQLATLSTYCAYLNCCGQLVEGSLLDNLCSFDANNSERVAQYSQSTGLDRIITRLPEGLESKVGQSSHSTLSQGGIKLLNIVARLAQGKPILLLDMPDSDLDIDSINKLELTLRNEAEQGRIIIMASHHPQLQSLATKLIKIQNIASEVA